MKARTRNFALSYLLFVALPLVGMVGVLRLGQKLSAPISVGGLWAIQVDSTNAASLPCTQSLTGAGASFTITQSGRSLTFNSGNLSISSTSGVIEGSSIKANITLAPRRTQEAGCDKSYTLTLTARVDSLMNAKYLAGLLSVDDCSECAPVEFRAIREESVKMKGSS
ncbi:MAG: hypothetical protein DMG65_22620 [Candidatus Angelobacter sp. Gp1-AA117]|nr:MAG: hypothetical protein DMG65_22620 [Candidatus Angelobacter sp. Gp1-AA117]